MGETVVDTQGMGGPPTYLVGGWGGLGHHLEERHGVDGGRRARLLLLLLAAQGGGA